MKKVRQKKFIGAIIGAVGQVAGMIGNAVKAKKEAKAAQEKYEKEQTQANLQAAIENKQAIEMVDMHRSILEGMMDGFASIINNNVNLVMKFLAAITIVLSIPTMLASFWGMNVAVPAANMQYGFWIVLSLSVLATLIVIIYFRKKGMF